MASLTTMPRRSSWRRASSSPPSWPPPSSRPACAPPTAWLRACRCLSSSSSPSGFTTGCLANTLAFRLHGEQASDLAARRVQLVRVVELPSGVLEAQVEELFARVLETHDQLCLLYT